MKLIIAWDANFTWVTKLKLRDESYIDVKLVNWEIPEDCTEALDCIRLVWVWNPFVIVVEDAECTEFTWFTTKPIETSEVQEDDTIKLEDITAEDIPNILKEEIPETQEVSENTEINSVEVEASK